MKNKYIFFKSYILAFILYLKFDSNNIFINNFKNEHYNNNHYVEFMINISKKNLCDLLNEKKYKNEIIILLINYIKFIKKKNIINKNKNKKTYLLLKNIYKNKFYKEEYIGIYKNDYYYLIQQFDEIINYKWEIIPEKILIDNLRYIIRNYYNEKCLEAFDKALNYNLRIYIQNNKNNFSYQEISHLMSKYFFFNFLNRKYWSI